MKHLILTIATLATLTINAGEKRVIDILNSYPYEIIKQELTNQDESVFTGWMDKVKESPVIAKIRYDGGHKGGYTEMEINGETFPVHVEFVYSGKLPKPGRQFKPRQSKCKSDTHKRHIKMTRTGKTVTVSGTILKVKPILKCACGNGDLITVIIKAESVK